MSIYLVEDSSMFLASFILSPLSITMVRPSFLGLVVLFGIKGR
jgi:hypothetical protein